MVVTTDHIGNPHQRIIDCNDKVVGRSTVRSCNDKVVENIFRLKTDLPFDTVFKCDKTAPGGFDTYDRFDTFGRRSFKVAISSIVPGALFSCLLRFTRGIELLPTHIAVVSLVFVEQLLNIFFIKVKSFRLIDYFVIV
ncbi:hypothetical protein D1872_261660 [compost metagenome]